MRISKNSIIQDAFQQPLCIFLIILSFNGDQGHNPLINTCNILIADCNFCSTYPLNY